MKKVFFSSTALMLVPLVSLAETAFDKILGLIGQVQTVLFALAFLFFFYGLAVFVLKSGGEDKKQGRDIMIWGTVALFIMFSIYGILGLLGDTIDLNQEQSELRLPKVIGTPSS